MKVAIMGPLLRRLPDEPEQEEYDAGKRRQRAPSREIGLRNDRDVDDQHDVIQEQSHEAEGAPEQEARAGPAVTTPEKRGAGEPCCGAEDIGEISFRSS